MSKGEQSNPKYKLINYCNEHYDIKELYQAVTGRVPGHGKIYCCFHSNTNTPAAKIYDNKMKCFGECNRLFGCYDFLKEFFPEELEKIKRSIIIPEISDKKGTENISFLKREVLNLDAGIGDIVNLILNFNGNT